MQDRVPLYPGRVILTPVSGQTNTYDMVLADQPQVTGTPLNKANLLADATAADILAAAGITPGTPNEAFDALANMLYTLDTTKGRIETGSYVGTGTYGSSNPCSLTFEFEPKLVIVQAHSGHRAVTTPLFLLFDCTFATIPAYYSSSTNGVYTIAASWSSTTVSWYCSGFAGSITSGTEVHAQMNYLGTTYSYIAIG